MDGKFDGLIDGRIFNTDFARAVFAAFMTVVLCLYTLLPISLSSAHARISMIHSSVLKDGWMRQSRERWLAHALTLTRSAMISEVS